MGWVELDIDGVWRRVPMVRKGDQVWVAWRGQSYRLEKSHGESAGADRPGDMRAPLTGKVITVDVVQGEAVREGQVLVVLEAMKMEYRLTAPSDGVVAALSCQAGELVDQGQLLVELDERSE